MNRSCHYLLLQLKCYSNVNVKAKYCVNTTLASASSDSVREINLFLALMIVLKILNINIIYNLFYELNDFSFNN